MCERYDIWELDEECMDGAWAAPNNIDYEYHRTERGGGYNVHVWVNRICEKTSTTNSTKFHQYLAEARRALSHWAMKIWRGGGSRMFAQVPKLILHTVDFSM